jgi:sugar lactone lactonase YvrE
MARRLDVVVDDVAFAEGLRWRDGALWYSDVGRGEVLRVVPGQAPQRFLAGLDHPSGLGWTAGGDLLIASLGDMSVHRAGVDGKARVWIGPDAHGTSRTNDMVTAGSRSYVSCGGIPDPNDKDASRRGGPIGQLVLVDHDSGACRRAAADLAMPNGSAITPDGRTFIVAETHGGRISAFDVQPDGMLSGRRVFAQVELGMPDGLALDADLGVWIGAVVEFQRYSPAGVLTDRIEVPGWRAIACALGGDDGRSLFMAMMEISDDPDAIFAGRTRGRILSTRVDAPAAPPPIMYRG